LSDVRVRRAINQAVNVPEILATVYGARGILARGAIPPALAGSDTTRRAYGYDPAAARRLLADAGHAGGVDLQLWRTAANVELSRAAQAIQSQLAAVGVRVELVERDASSQREAARKGQADMVILDWWADYPDADNFLLLTGAPGAPVAAMVGERADSATIARLLAELHIDDPLPAQFGHYVWAVLRGDLGRSYITQRPIVQDLEERFPKTVQLALAAMLLAALCGISVGAVAAVRPGGAFDRLAMLVSYLGVSFPVYWV